MFNNYFLTSNNEKIPILIKKLNKKAGIELKIQKYPIKKIIISKSIFISENSIKKIIEENKIKIDTELNKIENIKEKIKNGSEIEFLEKKILIKHNKNIYNNYYESDNILIIGGTEDKLEFRVKEFIKKEFLIKVKEIISNLNLDDKPNKITLKDTISQWGSCNINKHISLSWRLAFAPMFVIEYVIIHEIAHIKYMNHSNSFWQYVRVLYKNNYLPAIKWLKKNGNSLYKYF